MHSKLFTFGPFVLEGLLLGTMTVSQWFKMTATAITDEDWSRITSQHGVAFVACIATIVLWGTLVSYVIKQGREQKLMRREELTRRDAEEQSKEARHNQIVELYQHFNAQLLAINEKALNEQSMTREQVRVFDRNQINLTLEIKALPELLRQAS